MIRIGVTGTDGEDKEAIDATLRTCDRFARKQIARYGSSTLADALLAYVNTYPIPLEYIQRQRIMKSLARFVIRPDGEAQSLLLIGIAKPCASLRAGFVYEIRAFDSELAIVELGPSCIGPTLSTSEERAHEGWLESWGKTADALLEDCGKWLVATLAEWRAAKAAGVTVLACSLLAGCGGFGCPLGTVRVPDDRDPSGYRCEMAPRAATACDPDHEMCE